MVTKKTKAKAKTKATPKAKSRRVEVSAILEAAMDLAAESGWNTLQPADVAKRAGIALADLQKIAPTRDDILVLLAWHVDAAMVEGGVDEGESGRDKLFDLIMRRFDVLTPYRAGLAVVVRDMVRQPRLHKTVLASVRTSLKHILDHAGFTSDGVVGELRVAALGVLLLVVSRVWFNDESADLGPTMAELDRRLEQLEMVARVASPLAA